MSTETNTLTAPTAPAQKSKAPDPDTNPIGYLMHYGWVPQGNPKSRTTLWMDPTKPTKDERRMVERMRIVDKKTKKEEITMQEEYTPAGWPLSRDQALDVQMERDEIKLAKKTA